MSIVILQPGLMLCIMIFIVFVEEERIAVFHFTLGVVAEVQNILILVLEIRYMLAFLDIEIRNVLGGYKLVEVIFESPDQ